MIKRLMTILLAIAVLVSTGAPITFALGESDQLGSDEVFTVEVKDVTKESAKLIWSVADGKDYSYENASFSIYNGDEAIASELILLDENSSDENGYALEFDDEKNSDVFTYSLKGLAAETEYNIFVKDDDSEKNASGSVVFTTLGEDTLSEDDNGMTETDESSDNSSEGMMLLMRAAAVEPPANVTVFKAKQTDNNNVNLNWKAVNDADGYEISWSGNGKSGTINIDSGAITKYTHDIKVVDVKRYTYTIKAYKLDGDEMVKSESAKTAYIPAISLKATKVTAGTVTLKWTVSKPYGNAGNYKICLMFNGKNIAKARNIKAKASADGKYMTATYKLTGMGGGRTYKFYIRDTNSRAKSNTITVKSPVANVKNFKALSTRNAVILKWKKVARATGYVITWKEGKKNKKVTIKSGKTTSYLVELPSDNNYKFSIKATKKNFKSSLKASTCTGAKVRTLWIKMHLNTSRTLTSHTANKVTTNFPAGFEINAFGYSGGRYMFYHKGELYYVMRWSTSGHSVSKSDYGRTYSQAEAESFVNRTGLTSNTSYLIWANTYTQKEYIFHGSKGKWKLVQGPWEVSTGAPASPTSAGLTRIKDKEGSNNGLPYWNVCTEFSLHGKQSNWELGWPQSNGCVRNTNDHAKWIYYNCPIGTAVYVY